jgi:flotillin
MRRKATEGSQAQAKVEVAQARMRGEIGEREHEGQTKQRVSQIEAQTAINETVRKKEKAAAEADLKKRQVELNMEIKVAEIKAVRVAECKDAELQKNVEEKRAETEYARLQATDLNRMRVDREKIEQGADAELYAARKKADAEFYAKQKAVEALRLSRQIDADSDLYAKEKQAEAIQLTGRAEAEANLYAKQKEAEGINAVYEAQYQGFSKLRDAFNGEDTLMKYLMLEKGLFQELANANANAIRGLNPKINIWNTGIPSFDDLMF